MTSWRRPGSGSRARKPWQQDARAGDDTRPARASKPSSQQDNHTADGARPARARKPWEQDKPAFTRPERGEGRPAYHPKADRAPRQARDGDAPRAARPAAGKAGAKPSFKRQDRQDQHRAQRPRFA